MVNRDNGIRVMAFLLNIGEVHKACSLSDISQAAFACRCYTHPFALDWNIGGPGGIYLIEL